MIYFIKPLRGVNDIEFGMQRSHARQFMETTPEDFRRGDDPNPSDYYVEEGIFFYYDQDEYLEAIEFCRGAEVHLGTQSIFDMNFDQCLSFLRKFDPETVTDGDGATSHRLSFGVWVPFMTADEDDDDDEDEVGQIETVLVGRLGYYDFLKN